jgi:hypothetical protein
MDFVSSYESIGWRDSPENALLRVVMLTEVANALLPKVVIIFHDSNMQKCETRVSAGDGNFFPS